jgi:outer membrane murein-binding lipoprotein Lpp
LPDEASELFAAAPDRFVALRDSLAKELDREGRTDDARAVKALRKPTLATWALNQSALRKPDLVERLQDAGRTMSAAGSSIELRAASGERQALIRLLVNEATAALKEGGHPAAGPITDKITRTLLAISSGSEEDQFARGMLERELEPDLDFGFVAPLSAGGEDDGGAGPVDEARSKVDRLERQAKELEAEVSELERQARAAEDRVQLAQMEAERAAKLAEKARGRLAKQQGEAEEARAAMTRLKEAH